MDNLHSPDITIDTARYFGDAFIPDLPPDMQRVPGFRLKPEYQATGIPDGFRPTPGEDNPYEDPTWRTDYVDWRENALLPYRQWMWDRCETNATERETQKRLCFGDGKIGADGKRNSGCAKYFGAMYGWIQEPRAAGLRGTTWQPFVPYHYQLHQTDRFREVIALPFEEEIDIWEPKSRGMGVSWNRSKDDLHTWMSVPEARILIMSRSQPFVDSEGSIDALMEKILVMIERMPEWMRPEGFTRQMPWKKINHLFNQTNGAEIVGSPNTPDAARAGRYLYGFVDEAAKIRNLLQLLGSLRGSMKKVFYTSTEDREVVSGREWLEEWQAAKRVYPATVTEWNWHQNPTMDPEWERTVLARATSIDQRNQVKLEYFRDVFAGSDEYIYPDAKHIADADHPYDPLKPLIVTTDPGKEDDVAFLVGQTIVTEAGHQGFHVLFSYQAKLPEVKWMAHLRTGIWPIQGDQCWGMTPTLEEQKIGEFFYHCWLNGYEVQDYMDPYGDAALAGISYRTMLEQESARLRQREITRLTMQRMAQQYATNDFSGTWRAPSPLGIFAATGLLKKYKTHHERRNAGRNYLPHTTVQVGVMSAAWVRTCLTNHRMKKTAPDAVTEPKPVHDQYSHITSCYEFTMIYYLYGWTDPLPKPQDDLPQGRLRGRSARRSKAYGARSAHSAPAVREYVGSRYPVAPGQG